LVFLSRVGTSSLPALGFEGVAATRMEEAALLDGGMRVGLLLLRMEDLLNPPKSRDSRVFMSISPCSARLGFFKAWIASFSSPMREVSLLLTLMVDTLISRLESLEASSAPVRALLLGMRVSLDREDASASGDMDVVGAVA